MENLYLIRKMEIDTTHSLGQTTSETPNLFLNQEFSWEKLNEITETQLSQAKEMFKKVFANLKFSKLIVTMTYSSVNTPEQEHCISMGFDEEGEVYCS